MQGIQYNKGLSLIELLIVVIIIAILAAVAYPSYQRYKVKTTRGEMKTEMMNIAQRLHSFYVLTPDYSTASLVNLGLAADFPSDGPSMYNLNLLTTAQTWTLTATPVAGSIQDADGVLMLNELGQKCWTNTASSCSLSATSNWD